ncbi:MAG: helix-turn-helix transcriptional regulator [Solirubrobacterales bacterium]
MSDRFARNLTELRKSKGFSQEELAFRASIHRTQVSLMENGTRLPRFETLIKLAGALEVSPAALTAGIVWEPVETLTGGLRISEE